VKTNQQGEHPEDIKTGLLKTTLLFPYPKCPPFGLFFVCFHSLFKGGWLGVGWAFNGVQPFELLTNPQLTSNLPSMLSGLKKKQGRRKRRNEK
jgi:hypothetical protein